MRLLLPAVLVAASLAACTQPSAVPPAPLLAVDVTPETATLNLPVTLSPRLDYPQRQHPGDTLPFWIPLSAGRTDPLLAGESLALFEKDYAPEIARFPSAAPEDQLEIALNLRRTGSSLTASDPQLSLTLRGAAFRLMGAANAPLAQRASVAGTLASWGPWPYPRMDRTVAAQQLRADVMAALAKDAGDQATPALHDETAAAYLRLASAQLYAGAFKDAAQSLTAAMPFAEGGDANRTAQLKTMMQRLHFAQDGAAAYDRARAILTRNPTDPAANAHVATLYLALFADLETARPFARRSGRADLRNLAEALRVASDSNICAALLGVIAFTDDPVARYSIAEWTLERAQALHALTAPTSPASRELRLVIDRLTRIVEARPTGMPAYQDDPLSRAGPLLKKDK